MLKNFPYSKTDDPKKELKAPGAAQRQCKRPLRVFGVPDCLGLFGFRERNVSVHKLHLKLKKSPCFSLSPGTLVDLCVRQVHHVLVEVICRFDLAAASQALAEEAGAFKADAAHHDVTSNEVAAGKNHPVRLDTLDLTGVTAELVHEVSNKPDVAHGDCVAIMLHLLGPTFWHNAAGRFIQLLPSEELLHVCLRVMLVLSIPWLHKVEVVNGLENGFQTPKCEVQDPPRTVKLPSSSRSQVDLPVGTSQTALFPKQDHSKQDDAKPSNILYDHYLLTSLLTSSKSGRVQVPN